MPKDLLAVLREDDTIPPGGNGFRSAEIPETDTGLDEFFKEVEGIRESVDRIQAIIGQLHIKHTEVLAAPQQNERTKQEIEELTDAVKNSAGQVRLKLKQLEQAIHEQEAKDPSLATVRVRRTQHSTITRRFMDVMAAYNKEQTDYRDACKAQIKLKLEIAECPRTDEELEQMLESDNPQIFTQGILMDTQQARQNAADIEARHEDILKLEKSIRELHELFIDLAALVDSQSELLDRIEYNVDATQDHITGAVVATKKAKEYQKKSRKTKIIIGCVVGGVILLLLIILISSLVPR
ncbi:Syntaxin-1A [Clonorchis sinensis]|uniref:Syntaxin-1A n=1 Tax=Clonorchis sinensis TaxID=79923 RepID=A0A8T1MLZ7_CLOSI|nr:Syntaxin-1A [Clonorchis sinensis]